MLDCSQEIAKSKMKENQINQSPELEYKRTEGDKLAELQADRAAAAGKWEGFGAPAEVSAEAEEQWGAGLLSSIQEGLELDLLTAIEVDKPTAEYVVEKQQELGDRIIDLSGGGEVLPNKVIRAKRRLADGSEIYAHRTSDGRVVSVGASELTHDGRTKHSSVSFLDFGPPKLHFESDVLDNDGEIKKVEAFIVTASNNRGNISGGAIQSSPDIAARGSQRLELTESQAASVINSTLELIEQKTNEVDTTVRAA